MVLLRKAVALMLVAFWGLATAHCGLEQLPSLSFLACCEHPGSAPHQDNDCKQDACSVVESGCYRNDLQPAVVPVPAFVVSLLVALWEAPLPSDFPADQLVLASPPELTSTWQFSSRTALPPRAPSFVA